MQKATHLSETTKAPFRIPTDLTAEKSCADIEFVDPAASRRICTLLKDQEFPLAYQRSTFRDYHLLLDEQAHNSSR